jgi:hypothetical protein
MDAGIKHSFGTAQQFAMLLKVPITDMKTGISLTLLKYFTK